VDGLDQTPYRPGRPPKGKPVSTARLLGRWSRPGLDVLRAEATSPCYDAVHTRTVAFVDGDYWVVHDRLRAPTEHEYAARWHLAPVGGGAVELAAGRLSAPGLLLLAPHGTLRAGRAAGSRPRTGSRSRLPWPCWPPTRHRRRPGHGVAAGRHARNGRLGHGRLRR
jgi:hypothetical protein